MDAATRSDCNDNLTSSTLSSSYNNAAESTADRHHRHRARYGFGFKPPQAKPGRSGPSSRAAARPTMPIPPTAGAVVSAAGDEATAEDEERPSVNGVGDGRAAPTSSRGPPTVAKKRQKDSTEMHRQATSDRTKQSAVRRPAQKGSASVVSRQPVAKATASNGVTQAPDHSVQMFNGGRSKAPAPPPNGRGRPPSDKSVKLLVNYRSTNDRHAPLQTAYGNRDFFGSTSNRSSSAGAAGDAASAVCEVEVPQSRTEDVNQPAQSGMPRSADSSLLLILMWWRFSLLVTRWEVILR